jgi:DNA-binding SARP family transcriptional activator
MRAYAAADNQADALLTYERCRRLLMEELGANPSPATQALHGEILRGDHQAAQAAAQVTAFRITGTSAPQPELVSDFHGSRVDRLIEVPVGLAG